MFVQLRRVVYLLVLLQCCACVACAESSEEVTVTLQNTVTAEEETLNTKMNEKLQEFNMTAEQLLANGGILFLALQENVQTLQYGFKDVKDFVEQIKELVGNRIKLVPSVSQDTSDADSIEGMVKILKGMIKSVAETAEIVKLAMEYCMYWSDIMDKVIVYCGEPTGQHILGGDDEHFLPMVPEATYNVLFLVRGHMIAAIKRGNDTVEKVKENERVVEEALVELEPLNDTLRDEINEIRDDAKRNSATSFEEILKGHGMEMVFLEIIKEHGETTDQIRNEDQSREDRIVSEGVPPQQPSVSKPEAEGQEATTSQAAEPVSQPPSVPQQEPQEPQPEPAAPQAEHAAVSQSAEQATTSQEEPSEPQTQSPEEGQAGSDSHAEEQAESSETQETSSLESEETSTADVQTEEAANTTETNNSDTATPSITTAAAALIEAKKKGLQDAASGPMSSTAVLAVLALTVSTVIGMTVV